MIRQRFVLRRLGRNEYAADGLRIVNDPTAAKIFGSKISARVWLENFKDSQQLEWNPVDLAVCERVAETQTIDFSVAEPDAFAVVQAIHTMHHEYCDRVERWLQRVGVPQERIVRPSCEITTAAPNWSGLYSRKLHTCFYVATYGMLVGPEKYRGTVDHEVVHGYSMPFTGCVPAHDGAFVAMLEFACGRRVVNPLDPHEYSVHNARVLAEHNKSWWEEQAEAGTLTSLPCHVVPHFINHEDRDLIS